MTSQWDYFLQNLGEWHGSFTRMSPEGEEITDTPTLVTLEGLNDNKNVHQVVRYLPPDEASRDVVVDYDSLNRSILFFPNGAFSQGSMQWGSYSTFGGEFGLIDNGFGDGSRRLRMVELFDSSAKLDKVVLIREKLLDSNVPERPTLTVDSLLGEWQGEATTMYADLRNPTTFSSYLQVKQKDRDSIEQTLSFNNKNISSIARIEGSRLLFENSTLPSQILLLPDGASCNCPLKIELGHNFVLEMGWLVQPHVRQRIIRSYNEKGNWVSCTLVTEKKVV
ncbi:DUF3598 family protein [Waterburya agarophytonicola K14]|uniref:DUF3598 family protein n=1 Tax=Waterburya agarophytonicola KI4 TaxID=2874699 RepID=A0A964BTF3_9CYAN|nr:DUF3598 family protein [Waterburya agarophytonicola]MCC0179479.1 DUF3598 family protein [Waterburya agarophytonicola KI4]